LLLPLSDGADFLDLAPDCAAEIGEAIVVVSGTMPAAARVG
jgi:hypothetical protein